MFFKAFFVFAVILSNFLNLNCAFAYIEDSDKSAVASFTENFMYQVVNAGKEADSTNSVSKRRRENDANKYTSIFRIVEPNVDYKWITSFVMNEIYSRISDEEKKLLVKTYSEYAIKNYYLHFIKFADCEFKIKSVSKIGNEYMVSMDLFYLSRDAKNSNVVFRVRKNDAKFMVYDIIFDGYSVLIMERSKFKAKIVGKRMSFGDLIYYLSDSGHQ